MAESYGVTGRVAIAAACATLLLTASVKGQEIEEETPLAPAPRLRLTITPGVWIPRLNGTASQEPGGGEIDLETELPLRDSEPILNIEANIVKDQQWQLLLSGFDFETTHTGTFRSFADFGDVSLAPGDQYAAEVDLFSVGFEVSRYFHVPKYSKRRDVMFRAAPIGGMRYISVDQTIREIGAGREDTGGDWLGLFLGARFDVAWKPPFAERFLLGASAGVGPTLGGDGGFMWQIRASLSMFITENMGILFGFRLLQVDAENDGFRFDGGLQGLFVAATIRF